MDILFPLICGLGIGVIQGLFGAGGSLLAMPIILYGFQYPFRIAVGSSLALTTIGVLPALFLHWKNKQVDWLSAVLMGLSGMTGAAWASRFSHWVPQQWLFWLLITLMTFSALNMLGFSPLKPNQTEKQQSPPHKTLLLPVGFGIGVLSGLVGVGGGFLLVPALLLFGGLPPRQAIATSLAVITANALSGALSYLDILPVQESTLQLLALGSMIGSLIGFWLGLRLHDRHLKTGFGILLLGLIALMILMPPVH